MKKAGGISRSGLMNQGDDEYLELGQKLYSSNRFSCRSCYWYQNPEGNQAICTKSIFAGFPRIGDSCRKFIYEPGVVEL